MGTEQQTRGIGTPLSDREPRYGCELLSLDAGAFAVGAWQGTSPPILALHGISSNHLLWGWTAAADPALRIVAPDLRGRGGSTTDGPFGLERHRDDMLAVMDALELERVVLAGMSMGGFVATALAAAAPERVAAVLLVDGGLPFDLEDPAAALGQVSARGAAATTFATLEEYVDTYFAALGDGLDRSDQLLSAFLSWNLEQTGEGLTVRLPAEAIAQDARDTFGGAPTAEWLAALEMPVHLVHVAGSPLPIDAEGWASRLPGMTEERFEGLDHATIVMGEAGGTLVASALQELIERVEVGR